MNSSTCPGAKNFTTIAERHRSKAPTYWQVRLWVSNRSARKDVRATATKEKRHKITRDSGRIDKGRAGGWTLSSAGHGQHSCVPCGHRR